MNKSLALESNPSSSSISPNSRRGADERKPNPDRIMASSINCLLSCLEQCSQYLQVEVINPLFLLTAKPVVYLVNLSERDYIRQKNKHLPKIAQWIQANAAGDPIIPISVSFEERLTQLGNDEAVEDECKKLNTKSALPKVIVTMRKALNLISFFTTGTDEVRQWTIRMGTKAPQAAGVIHTDFEKTFIQAIIYNYDTLREEGNEAEVKAKGKVMTKGKDYVMQDGDIMLVKAGAAKG